MNCLRIIRNWRRWIGFVVIVTYVVLLVIALPLCIWQLEEKGAPDHVEAWFIGGLFVLMALPISFWGILQHVINYTCPYLQRHIIRILWMVPVYALNAWFALRFPAAAIYLDTLRECYEAYVIYNFMAYLLSFLHHEYPHLGIQVENNPPVKLIFPLCLLPPCQNGIHFIQRCKHGVLQYTIVRPTMTVIALFCEMFDKYDEGDFNFTSAWSYIVIINNVSQVIAMYCLVLFYRAFKEELKPIKPLPKFVCVKAVVFMSFWQMVAIAALAKLNLIPQNGTWVFYKNIKEVATGLQDFLICIEMFIAAIAHYLSFSHKPYVNLAAEQQNCCASFLSMWNISDVTDDVVEHARYVGNGVQKRLLKKLRRRGESTPLLNESSTGESSSAENVHANQPNTPAVLLGEEDVTSLSNSLSGRYYDSFAARSTTSSMNNYADFNVSGDVSKDKSKQQSTKVYAYQDLGDDTVHDEGKLSSSLNAQNNAGAGPSEDAFSSPQRRIRENPFNTQRITDDEYEHLDKVEDGSNDEEEEVFNDNNTPKESHAMNSAGNNPVV